jgi:hypothetical protein
MGDERIENKDEESRRSGNHGIGIKVNVPYLNGSGKESMI